MFFSAFDIDMGSFPQYHFSSDVFIVARNIIYVMIIYIYDG